MGLGRPVSRIVAFLRAGYPRYAPALGYVPLLALLPRRVSDDEIATIAGKLLRPRHRQIDNTDVGVGIIDVTDEMPSTDDIERVQRRLVAMRSVGDHQD
jgi:hypothetical protein